MKFIVKIKSKYIITREKMTLKNLTDRTGKRLSKKKVLFCFSKFVYVEHHECSERKEITFSYFKTIWNVHEVNRTPAQQRMWSVVWTLHVPLITKTSIFYFSCMHNCQRVFYSTSLLLLFHQKNETYKFFR